MTKRSLSSMWRELKAHPLSSPQTIKLMIISQYTASLKWSYYTCLRFQFPSLCREWFNFDHVSKSSSSVCFSILPRGSKFYVRKEKDKDFRQSVPKSNSGRFPSMFYDEGFLRTSKIPHPAQPSIWFRKCIASSLGCFQTRDDIDIRGNKSIKPFEAMHVKRDSPSDKKFTQIKLISGYMWCAVY